MTAYSGKIRLLIVNGRTNATAPLKELLTFDKSIEIVGTVVQPQQALGAIERLRPDVAMIDLSTLGMEGVTTSEAIKARVPDMPIVVVLPAGKADVTFLRRAMMAGAREYLMRPFGRHVLSATLHRVYPPNQNGSSLLALPAPSGLALSEPAPSTVTDAPDTPIRPADTKGYTVRTNGKTSKINGHHTEPITMPPAQAKAMDAPMEAPPIKPPASQPTRRVRKSGKPKAAPVEPPASRTAAEEAPPPQPTPVEPPPSRTTPLEVPPRRAAPVEPPPSRAAPTEAWPPRPAPVEPPPPRAAPAQAPLREPLPLWASPEDLPPAQTAPVNTPAQAARGAAGVTEFEAPPANLRWRAAERRGQIIVIYSGSGGIGRTTLAVNLALAINNQAQGQVALVDANLRFGDVGVFLNLRSKRTIADLLSMKGMVDLEILPDIMAPHPSGVKALLTPPTPELADLITPTAMIQILTSLRAQFDYIIVDTHPSLSEVMLAILDMADQIFLLTTTEVPALKNTRLFLQVAEMLKYPTEKIMLILARHDPKGRIKPRDVEASIGHRVFSVIERDEKLASEAINDGVPFLIAHPKAPISQAITEIAARLVQPARATLPIRKAGLFARGGNR